MLMLCRSLVSQFDLSMMLGLLFYICLLLSCSEVVKEIFLPYFDGGNKLSKMCYFSACSFISVYPITLAFTIVKVNSIAFLRQFISHGWWLIYTLLLFLVIWFQNTSIYHFSMFHASHHLTPVMATDSEVDCTLVVMLFCWIKTAVNSVLMCSVMFLEIEAEVNAVKQVAEAICPLTIVLDQVVLTSTGVLLGCWQVRSLNLLSLFYSNIIFFFLR